MGTTRYRKETKRHLSRAVVCRWEGKLPRKQSESGYMSSRWVGARGQGQGLDLERAFLDVSFTFLLQWRPCCSQLLFLPITVHGSWNWFEGKFQACNGVGEGKKRMQYPFLKTGCNHLADYLILRNAVRSEPGSPFNGATAPTSRLWNCLKSFTPVNAYVSGPG